MMEKLLLQFVLILCLWGCYGVAAQNPVFACDVLSNNTKNYGFCNTALDLLTRAHDLVSRLTLKEKIGLLGSNMEAVPRLGIPTYKWWSEALHGVSSVGGGSEFSGPIPGATSFPQVILTAASFNNTLFETIGKVVSTEARAMHNVGLAGLTFWSPNINVFRDPRWGRGQETPGEDPKLVSDYGVSYVKGLQDSGDPNKLKVSACCKHYTAYDLDNWKGLNRFTFDAVVTKQDMEDTFQPPFRSCVMDADVASVMCSYNKVNGVPTCADPNLLLGTVRNRWRLNGYIVSDCDSVEVIFNKQHYTKTPGEAVAKTISAGLDLDCGHFVPDHALEAVHEGKLKEADVDRAITNNLVTLMRLGFFDGDPRKLPLFGNLGPKDVCTPEHRELAREAARQGIVLLKNENKALPIVDPTKITMTIVGPNAKATKTMIGNYHGIPCRYTTPLQGLSEYKVSTTIIYQPGCANVKCTGTDFQLDPAKQAAAQANFTVIVVGTDQDIEAEEKDREDLLLPGQQTALVTEVANAAKGPVILVIMSGGPLDISFAKNHPKISSILWVGFPGEAGGEAMADIIFGQHNPSGKSPFTWYPQSYADKVPMNDMRMRPDAATGYPGRTHRFYTGETIYKFGDGLSYTDFTHQLIQAPQQLSIPLQRTHPCNSQSCKSLDLAELRSSHCSNSTFDVHLRVRNSGSMTGSHTVLLFNTPPSVHNSPKKQLLGFQKLSLEPNAETDVAFKVDLCKDLSVVDELGNRRVALGPHTLHVGDIQHPLNLTIQ